MSDFQYPDEPAGPSPDDDAVGWLPFPAKIGQLSAGQKLIYTILAELGEASAQDIMYSIHASPGTVYPALHALEDLGIAERRPALDGKRDYWRLTDPDIELPETDAAGGEGA